MSCPFRHLWPASRDATAPAEPAGQAAVQPSAASGPSRCPFSGRRQEHSVESAAGPSRHDNGVGQGTASADVRGACAAAAPTESSSSGAPADLEPSTPTARTGQPPAGQCPFLAGMSGVAITQPADTAVLQPQNEGEGAAAEPAMPAVCPLGFGSQQGPKLGQFHCLLCKSLFHDCVVTSCGHRYCAGCIRDARDCPACGADVTSLEADGETQALVERYIDAHAGSHTIWELEGPAGSAQQVDGMAGERSRASFLLQLGLRALAAGNIGAARHRLLACQQELEQQLQAAEEQAGEATSVAAIQSRLGAVSGCLGDCCRAEGDAAGTLQHYERSVELLRAAGDDSEAQQALSVALNKMGELRHLQGQLADAAALYAEALQLRRSLLAAAQQQQHHEEELGGAVSGQPQAAQGDQAAGQAGQECASSNQQQQAAAVAGEACCSAALDLAASCIKLAGAQLELGNQAEAQELTAEASGLLNSLEEGMTAQPPLLQRKFAKLAQFVAMLTQQLQEQLP